MTVKVVGLYGFKNLEHEIPADSFSIDDESGHLTVFKNGIKVAAFAPGSWASVVSESS